MTHPKRAVFCALLAFLYSGAPLEGATIFSNLVQPGNLYGPDLVGVGAIPAPGTFLYSATDFTPAFDAVLTGLLLPVFVVVGPPEVDVFLMEDAGDLPGRVIESFHITRVPPAAGPSMLLPITSIMNPLLTSGTQYWVAVTGGTPATFGLWALTLFRGDPMAGGATRVVRNGIDSGWVSNPGSRVGALVVTGVPIPEPTPAALIGAAIAVLLWMRRRAPQWPERLRQ